MSREKNRRKRERQGRKKRAGAKFHRKSDNVIELEQDDPVVRALKFFARHDYDPSYVTSKLFTPGPKRFARDGEVLEIDEKTRLGIIVRFSRLLPPEEPKEEVQETGPIALGQHTVVGSS